MSVSPATDTQARRRRAAGDRLEVRCGAMVHGGGCLAKIDDGTILVEGAIPEEVVEVELYGRRRGVWWARVVRVIEPSPHRVIPPCPYVPDCGGCDLQHIAYPQQLELKREIVRDAMRRQHVPLPDHVPVHGMSEPWRYRWRGEFHLVPGDAPGEAAGLGFNRARSWDLIAVDDCLIHHEAITTALPALREAVDRGATPGLRLLHLTAGEDGHELLVRTKPSRGIDPAVLDETALERSAGARWITEATTLRWRGRSFRVLPDTFIQVNQSQMDVLYQRVLDGLGDIRGVVVVDAYAGIGVLSTVVAADAAEVVCIEENHAAASVGVLNTQLNGVEDRVRYVARPVEEALPEIGATTAVDAVVLDPPRAGCASSVTAWLALAGPPIVVYVSCDPATLARDLRVLAASGPYNVARLELVDMFPQTHHIESVAVLHR